MQITPDNVSIERIGGVEYTVVWHGSLGHQVKSISVGDRNWRALDNGVLVAFSTQIEPDYGKQVHFATALPPLPRNPKASDAWLLYRYCSEGIFPKGKYFHETDGWKEFISGRLIPHVETGYVRDACDPYEPEITITHCVTESGERVEVAIKGV